MYLRCGTLLRLFQEEFNEPLTAFSKRIETVETTVNSYQTGYRQPNPDSGFLFKFKRFLADSINEMKLNTEINIEQFALKTIYLEHYFNSTHDSFRLTFQKAALDTIVAHIELLTNKTAIVAEHILETSTGDCIKTLFKSGSNDFSDKLVIALYLARLAIKSGLILEYSDYVMQRPFRDLTELVASARNNTLMAKWPLTVDILMSLPVSINFEFDMQELFKIKVTNNLDDGISPSQITAEGHIFPVKKNAFKIPQSD